MVLKTHPVEARCLAFSPDSQTLATGGFDRVVRLCDVLTGQELLTLKGHAQKVNSLTFSPDGQTLVSGSHDGAVRLWRSTPQTLSTGNAVLPILSDRACAAHHRPFSAGTLDSGARNVDYIITRRLLPEMSREFLTRMATGEGVGRVHTGKDDHGAFRYEIS